jgi:hypothetical protein
MQPSKRSTLVVSAFVLAAGCAPQSTQPKRAGMSGALGSFADAGAAEHARECASFGNAASSAFDAALPNIELDQCRQDSDCDPPATPDHADMLFNGDSDGCWSSCSALAGTSEYIAALKGFADYVCSEFRSKGCVVVPISCNGRVERVVSTCVNAKCVSTQ